jgi:hypothetical protein
MSIINHTQPGATRGAHGSQCPPWCIATPDPADPDMHHVGEYSAVPLSLGLPGEALLGRLEKGYSSPGTYVALVHLDEYLDLTVAEAAELAGLLAALVHQVLQIVPDGAR